MKKFFLTTRQSFKAIWRNKGRSFLTILGIIIGIGSVIALISLGNGVKTSISGQINQLGSTNLTITPGQSFTTQASSTSSSSSSSSKGPFGGGNGGGLRDTASTLTVTDLQSLENTTKQPNIKLVSGQVSGSSVFSNHGTDLRYSIVGTTPSYFKIQLLSPSHGVVLNNSDVSASKSVAVVGSQFADEVLGGSSKAVGQTIQINSQNYLVVGVLSTANETSFTNPNDQVYIPYTTAMTSFSTQTFTSMTAQATSQDTVDAAKADITATLLKNHGITNPSLADFSVNSAKDILSAVDNITGVLTSLLAGIAAISLLVGGIGIMNIMLVSVTERTREIGLRKAVGAKTHDILGQFIIEALILTLLGGLLGIGFGLLIGAGAGHALNFKPVVTMSSVILAVGVSTLVGLVFGIYPAAKASRLNPIDALRYE